MRRPAILYLMMDPLLQNALHSAGWRSGTLKGFLRTSRAGIEFEVGLAHGAEGRLELRYRYHTERTHAEGEVPLPEGADISRIEDAMTSVYQRIHEKPDMSRVFGGGRRKRGNPLPAVTTPTPPEDPGQGALDF